MNKEELKAFRETKGMNQKEFASYLGLKREKTISDYERGAVSVPDWLASRIALEKKLS